MRRVMLALVISAVMLGCGSGILLWLHHGVNDLLDDISTAEQQVRNGEVEQALSTLKLAQEDWREDEIYFSRLLRHRELDSITVSLDSLPAYLEYGDLASFFAMTSQAKCMITHIWEAELPVWNNLL